jgi:hypothetical protein
METASAFCSPWFVVSNSHSLGILIEWKHGSVACNELFSATLDDDSHSLGILIEWKLHFAVGGDFDLFYSHSLGILIEWKLHIFSQGYKSLHSHSLGILIEWKQVKIGVLAFI